MTLIVSAFTRGFLLFGFLLLSSPCWAYYDVLDTGEILPKGGYKVTGDAQLLTETGGLNVGGIFDMGIEDQFGARALAGFGSTDYFMGGLFKWMPIPDLQGGQPAVGFNVGLLYGKWDDNSDLTLRWEPLVSKKLNVESAVITPYASLPMGIRMRNSAVNSDSTVVSWQLVVGSQLQVEKWKNLQFIGEIGLDLGNALSHISVGAIWYFDTEHGFTLN